MPGEIATVAAVGPEPAARAGQGPLWGLRVDGSRVAVVLSGAVLQGGGELGELAIHLPHVGVPFDFREGIERFRHHRGEADVVEIALEARLLLDWLHRASGGRLTGRAVDDALVLQGRADGGARFTVRARFLPDPQGPRAGEREPGLVLSLYDVRVYGEVDVPWPTLAGRVLDLLPSTLVRDRTLTTARLALVRPTLLRVLAGLGWKMPETAHLRAKGVELRDGRLVARFLSPRAPEPDVVTLEAVDDPAYRGAFQRFVEDLELKRHHGQIDRLLEAGEVREALAEVYRALDGPPRPGFIAERLVGIAATRPILHDEGERVCRGLLELAPDYAPAHCGLAAIALARDRPEEAAVHLERLGGRWHEAADREDATAAELTIAELLAEVDPDEARAALERVLERSPDHEEALEQLIGLAERRGETAHAVGLYKRLLFSARSPERLREAGLRLARHALARREVEEARIFLKVVLEAAPHDPEARSALADVEVAEGRPAEAARLLEGALRALPPQETRAMARVITRLAGVALEALGQPGRARRILWRAADVSELDAGEALELARLSLGAGDPELAARYAERVEAGEDAWPRAACLLARARLLQGDREAALRVAVHVLERAPGDDEALGLVEEAAAGVQVRERLLLDLRRAARAVTEAPARARLHRAVARLYESLDLHADAIDPWAVAFDAEPEGPEGRAVAERLLALYARFGMWPRHQALCRRLLEGVEDPLDRVSLLVRLGRVALREQGDPEVAREALEEAADLAPRQAEASALLWEAREALGEVREAIPVLRRLATIHPDEALRGRASIRLAELLITVADAPGEARAVLARLPPRLSGDERITRLLAQSGGAPPEPDRSPGPSGGQASPSEYQEALALADAGRSEEALARLQALLDREPDHVPARELAGLLAEALLRDEPEPPEEPAPEPPPRAEPDLPEPVADRLAEGERVDALLDDAREAFAAGDEGSARRSVEALLDLDGDCLEALEMKAELLRVTGEQAERARILERLMGLAFDAAETKAYARERARLLGEIGRGDEAAEAWRGLLEWDALDDEAFEQLAAWLRERKDAEALVDFLDRRATAAAEAAREAPEPRLVHRLVARARTEQARIHLRDLDDPEAAEGAAEDGLRAAPDDPELLEILVRALAATNQRGRCREAIDRLLPMLVEGPLEEEMKLLRGS